jgi:protein phosphatase 1 regulatory subunit 11
MSFSSLSASTQTVAPSVVVQVTTSRLSRHVSFSAETVDNELLNRKKSKVCCIFNVQRDSDSSEDDRDPSVPNQYEIQKKKKIIKPHCIH